MFGGVYVHTSVQEALASSSFFSSEYFEELLLTRTESRDVIEFDSFCLFRSGNGAVWSFVLVQVVRLSS